MSPTEITTLGTGGGVLVGMGIAWGFFKASLGYLKDSVHQIKADMTKHHEDKMIHLDPVRDKDQSSMMMRFLEEKFDDVTDRLEVINERCERRGGECANHFSNLEKKYAAITGKANGQ
jgi:hypothetical protein